MKTKHNKVATLAATLITFGSLAGGANGATIVTTSGSAVSSDVQLGFSETFTVTTAGTIAVILFGNSPDSERDAVQFSGVNQLAISVNSVPVASSFQDLNDGVGALGSFIFFDNGPTVSIGDTIIVSGNATNGAFAFGNSAATFSLFPSGSYDIVIADGGGSTLAVEAIPEPSSALLVGLGGLGLLARRRRNN